MSVKSAIGVVSVFLIILCFGKTQCDVSHVVLGGESSVDTGTIELLRKNISDYLVELEHGGSPAMQLKQIYSASKQIVTGTLYTVQALLETPDGAKKCQIRVLEKPWIDFCQVRVTCEHGGHYEVTFNPNHISQEVSHELKPISNYLPSSVYHQPAQPAALPQFDFKPKPQSVSLPQNPFLNQFTNTHVQQQGVKLPEFTTFKPFTTAKPATLAPFKYDFKPQPPKPVFVPQNQFTTTHVHQQGVKLPEFTTFKPFTTAKPAILAPVKYNYKPPKTPFVPQNQYTTTHVHHQGVKLPEFTTFKPFTTFSVNPLFDFKPTQTPVFKPQPTLPPLKPQPIYKAPSFPTLAPLKPQPVYKPQPLPTLPPQVYKPQPLPTLPPQPVYKPQPLPTLPPQVYKPQPLPTLPPQPVYKPQPLPTLPPQVYKPQPLPTFPPQPVYKPQPLPTFPPQPVYKPQPLPTLPPQPQPLPVAPQHDFPIKPTLIPKPLPPKPELNVLPFDQLPQSTEALNSYLDNLFHDFMAKYDREYIAEPSEMAYRYDVFKNNFHTMHEHSKTDRLACEYSVTEFADLTNNEFERILGFDTSLLNATDIENADIPGGDGEGRSAGGDGSDEGGEIPEHYDQREENLVTRVKFQGDCGACWAFVTTAVIEGLCAKRTKTLQEFSEQSLIDCDNTNYGCKGGVPPNAMKHIAKRGGLELESVYPFEFAKSTCRFKPPTVRVKVAGPIGFKKNDEAGMARWLFKNGPILVGMNADPLKYYKGGVLNPTPQLCNPKKVNHAVTLIGYGVEVNTSTGEKLPYWIVKNQWGTRFGEDGYFRIARGKNACGLALWAYSAKLSNVENNCLLKGA